MSCIDSPSFPFQCGFIGIISQFCPLGLMEIITFPESPKDGTFRLLLICFFNCVSTRYQGCLAIFEKWGYINVHIYYNASGSAQRIHVHSWQIGLVKYTTDSKFAFSSCPFPWVFFLSLIICSKSCKMAEAVNSSSSPFQGHRHWSDVSSLRPSSGLGNYVQAWRKLHLVVSSILPASCHWLFKGRHLFYPKVLDSQALFGLGGVVPAPLITSGATLGC